MKLTFNIVENNSQIQQKILIALLPECKDYFDNAITKIKVQLPTIVSNAIVNSPEYIAITSGQLKFELGIPNPIQKITGLLNLWMSNIVYNYNQPKIGRNTITSSFSAELIKTDFSDVLGSDFASVQDSSGYSLPWLKWLLLDGSATLVPNHTVVFGPNSRSRTGNAIMRINSNQGWGIPSIYKGTIADNWITRAIANAAPEIQNLLDGAVK